MNEARALSGYLLGRPADARTLERYVRARQTLGYDGDDAVVRFALAAPWSMPMLDGACALVRPKALLRRKLALMVAILETQPAYARAFLACDRPPAYAFVAAGIALRAALQSAAGVLLLAFLR